MCAYRLSNQVKAMKVISPTHTQSNHIVCLDSPRSRDAVSVKSITLF